MIADVLSYHYFDGEDDDYGWLHGSHYQGE